MTDLFRESTFGTILNYLSKGRILPYPEEKADFITPVRYVPHRPATREATSEVTLISSPATKEKAGPEGAKALGDLSTAAPEKQNVVPNEQRSLDPPVEPPCEVPPECRIRPSRTISYSRLECGSAICDSYRNLRAIETRTEINPLTPIQSVISEDASKIILVDWEGPDDLENPKNWPLMKRLFVTAQISVLTFGVYSGSAIYTPSIPGIMEEFDTSLTVAVLGLSLFVFGYGIGPMLLTPLQEFPAYGRTPVYIISMTTFTLLQLPIIYAKNVETIMIFRFITGFIGSPALATGGATLIDIWPDAQIPYAMATWAIGAVCGPVLGPVIAGFPAMNKGWQWSILLLTWISGFVTVVLFFFLPETLGATILYKRAARLRKASGNEHLRSQSEIDQANMRIGAVFTEALTMPLRLLVEPAVFVTSLYLGLVYAIFYLFFESFPLVYAEGGVYNWNLGVSQLPFIAFAVTGALTFTGYVFYQKLRIGKLYATGKFVPEDRLEIGLIAACSIPIVTLIFGWTARKSVHWIVPVIFGACYLPGVYLSFQSILVYLPTAYYSHAGSVLAANDLFRSTLASVFPLFGHAFYKNLGLGPGSTLLAGLSALMIPLFWVIKHNGAKLRARSKFAHA